MMRISTFFIAVCMIVIAGSLGVAAAWALGFGRVEAVVTAVGVLTVLILYNTAATRLRDRSDVGDQIADLSRGTADLARQVAEYGRRLQVMETEIRSVRRPTVDLAPVSAEIGELGTLVKDLAESVAAIEARIAAAPAAPEPAAVATAVPAAAAVVEPAAALTSALASALSSPPAPAAAIQGAASPAVDAAAKPAVVAADRAIADGPFRGLMRTQAIAQLADAVASGRLELHLQPVVSLPQRKVRFYEGLARIKSDAGELIAAADFIPYAEAGGLMPKIDNAILFRCVQVLRRLLSKNREVGLFCNISAASLADAAYFPQLVDFMEANRALAPSLVLEFTQDTIRTLGPLETEGLAVLAEQGFRFSVDNVSDLRIEPRELSERGFRYIKVAAPLLLGSAAATASDIHPADLSGLLGRFGIDLIVERIEKEATVIDLLDYDVRFGQGFLFSPPRPVRPEALQPGADRLAGLPVGGSLDSGSAVVDDPEKEAVAETRNAGNRALAKAIIARGAIGAT